MEIGKGILLQGKRRAAWLFTRHHSGTVDLISYDDFDLQCLKKDSALKRGSDLSKVFRDSNFVLATSDQDSTWKIGDTVQIGDETLTIAGLLKNDPFSENGLTNGKLTLITSDETFVRLTGGRLFSCADTNNGRCYGRKCSGNPEFRRSNI